MKSILLAAIVGLIAAGAADATCVGSNQFASCYDSETGNNYTVSRFGNSTTVYGSNPNTGSTWSQQSYGVGTRNEQTYGQDSRGNTWHRSCVNGFCY